MMQPQSKPETLLLITNSDFKKVVDYMLSVPTGTLPGSRLAEVLNILDRLIVVPSAVVPVLQSALQQIAQPPTPPIDPPNTSPSSDKKPNGTDVAPVE